MEIHEAVMAFSQSEKIKSGLIWISQTLEILRGLGEPEKRGAEAVIGALVGMVVGEIRLAGSVAADAAWQEIENHVDRAVAMVQSGVGPDSVVHLTQALSQVTSIGHRSMSLLRDKGVL